MHSMIANFINKKKEEENIKNSNLSLEIEKYSITNKTTMSKAAQSLNVLQTLKVSSHLTEFTEKLENPINEIGYKFKDNSILINQNGRLLGLSFDESSLWEKGIYFKSKIEMPIVEENSNNVVFSNNEESKTFKLSM